MHKKISRWFFPSVDIGELRVVFLFPGGHHGGHYGHGGNRRPCPITPGPVTTPADFTTARDPSDERILDDSKCYLENVDYFKQQFVG